MISGPMPSPGRVMIRWLTARDATRCRSQRGGHRYRRGPRLALALVVGDRCVLLQRQRDVVEPAEQAVADLVVDREGNLLAGEAHLLGLEVDLARARTCKRVAVLGGEHDGEQPYLGAVGVEDVGERGCDDSPEAVVLKAPGSVLARGAAAKVLAGDEDRVGGQIPPWLLGPIVEKELAEA